MANATCEIIWIQNLISDLGVRLSTPLLLFFGVIISLLYLTANPFFHVRTKHIEIDYYFVRERVARGQLNV